MKTEKDLKARYAKIEEQLKMLEMEPEVHRESMEFLSLTMKRIKMEAELDLLRWVMT